MRRALTIAGSDSSAGAGIQQDLRVFDAFGLWGVCAVTSVTAQRPSGVARRFDLPAGEVEAQISAVAAEPGVDAAKTGMLATAAVVEAVAASLEGLAVPFVVDPVMVSSSGAPLLDESAIEVVRRLLIPACAAVTPNAAEAAILTGLHATAQRDAARALVDMGAAAAIVTGGDGTGDDSVDVLADAGGVTELRGRRVDRRVHGTGCVFSAALTAGIALGADIREAAARAKEFTVAAIEGALRTERGTWVANPGKGF